MEYTKTVTIPDGPNCIKSGKPCIFARYTKKWNAYNCAIYHRILKGGQTPVKCDLCVTYCESQKENSAGDTPT